VLVATTDDATGVVVVFTNGGMLRMMPARTKDEVVAKTICFTVFLFILCPFLGLLIQGNNAKMPAGQNTAD